MPDSLIAQTAFTAIDFESAGTAPGKTDAPIQIGTTTWSIEKGISDLWESYISTEEDITWAAQKVHGITRDDLQDAPKLALLWPQIKQRLKNHIVVAHGHGTEKRFLRGFPGHGFGPWVDTLVLSRRFYPQLPSHSLGAICDHFELSQQVKELVPLKTWHDALFDAAASVVLLQHMIKEHKLEDRMVAHLF